MAPSGALRAAPRNALESREHPRLRAGSLSNAETETRPLHGAPGTVCPKAASAARGGRTWGAEGVAPAVSEAERRREGSAGIERARAEADGETEVGRVTRDAFGRSST